MKFYFVRHGRTSWNEEGRLQGTSADSLLTPQAIEETILLGQALRYIAFDRVYSSDLNRAIQTSEILMSQHFHPSEIETTSALREWHLGNLEGQKLSVINAIYPKQMHAFNNNLAKFNPTLFDAETVYQATHRVGNFIYDVANKELDNILIVSHGAILSASMGYLLGYPPALLRRHGFLDNTSLSILETHDGKTFKLLTWNSLPHLETSTQKPIYLQA